MLRTNGTDLLPLAKTYHTHMLYKQLHIIPQNKINNVGSLPHLDMADMAERGQTLSHVGYVRFVYTRVPPARFQQNLYHFHLSPLHGDKCDCTW